MDGVRTARWSLRLDAVYCAAVAAIAWVGADLWASGVGVPVGVLRMLAGVVALWAVLLWAFAGGHRLVGSLWLVGAANLVAAVALAGVAMLVPSVAVAVVLVAVAVEVAGFACS